MKLTRAQQHQAQLVIELTWDHPDKAEVRWPEERSSSPLWDFPWHGKGFQPSRSGMH